MAIECGGGVEEDADWRRDHATRASETAAAIQFSTRAQGRPLRFLLGGRQVIDGVDEAVTGMRVGEQRRLVVAPHLSRRSSYPAGLSPNDTLHYELELVAIESPQEPAHRSR
jgi:hypothetical protein